MSSSDLPLMDLASIHAATDNFSKANKLGEGGFGPVYRVRSLHKLHFVSSYYGAKISLLKPTVPCTK